MGWHNGRPSGWYPGSFERAPAWAGGSPSLARGVAPWVRELTEEAIGGAALRIGGRYVHPEHGEIEVTDGQYWGTYGVSNLLALERGGDGREEARLRREMARGNRQGVRDDRTTAHR
jgi:hypothetical protein